MRTFLNAVWDGFDSFRLFPPPMKTYEERFGTDAELIASDWRKVAADLWCALFDFAREKDYERKQSVAR